MRGILRVEVLRDGMASSRRGRKRPIHPDSLGREINDVRGVSKGPALHHRRRRQRRGAAAPRNLSVCSDLVADLRYIAEAAKLLVPMEDPSPRVWNGIQESLEREGMVKPARKHFYRHNRTGGHNFRPGAGTLKRQNLISTPP